MTTPTAVSPARFLLSLALVLLGLTSLTLLPTATASAAPLVGKDGKIHACYKWKGKKKGTLRVVRSRKVRCPRKWKKVSWHARGMSAPLSVPGPAGPPGPQGVPGPVANVEALEAKVDELMARIESLEALFDTLAVRLMAAIRP